MILVLYWKIYKIARKRIKRRTQRQAALMIKTKGKITDGLVNRIQLLLMRRFHDKNPLTMFIIERSYETPFRNEGPSQLVRFLSVAFSNHDFSY